MFAVGGTGAGAMDCMLDVCGVDMVGKRFDVRSCAKRS